MTAEMSEAAHIQEQLQHIFDEGVFLDLPEDMALRVEKQCCDELQKLCARYGAEAVLKHAVEFYKADSYELYWFARAGIKEVIPMLEPLLQSEDENILTDAVSGLIHFEHDGAFDVLRALIEGSHVTQLTEKPAWYFKDDLQRVNTERSLKLQDALGA